ncbi:hypothetical protein GEV33_003464 [Tenebrio molitor]|uniref:DH domain-containing protein n=1 Tax=Tenebrio molitor TaxID=7067 RepID=A0A8J6HS37_TENMO|nr:hypothetical protein GEV33_003464 [Tenebrio molitor]
MITSEASYLNSLNVLYNHFIKNLANSEMLSKEEFDTLFGKVEAVKVCSEKLIYDLEKCWQENILLHGVCDIVQKHAEENFHVYVSYCENQILLDETLRGLKEKPSFVELLRQLESSSTCQSLTLYSFLMLPMQRITRWPLLADAVLKRLSPQDSEYLTCQYSLATLNTIVNQCNEGARRKERENEMRKIITQLEFGKGVPPVEIISEGRWLIRSGSVTHMQQRSDEIKLTFGKRFVKITLHLFLFNDLLIVTKPKR